MEPSCVSVFTRKRLTVTLDANGKDDAPIDNSSEDEGFERGRQATGDRRGYERDRSPTNTPFSGGRECLDHIYIAHLIQSSPLSRPYKSHAQTPNGGTSSTASMQALWIFDPS